MKWQETDHSSAATEKAEKMLEVQAFSPDTARVYAEKMFKMRNRGWGDETDALEDVARWCGMTPRSLKRLIKGETKDPGLTVFGRVRAAYIDYCQRLISELQHEVAIDQKRYGEDAALADFADEVAALAAKVRRAKEAR